MKHLIIVSLVFITSILSCTKVGRNITVKGKVLNPLTGTTYEGIKVQLIRSKNLQLPGGYTEIKHTHTDANGEFELNATRLGDVWVQAQSGSDLYVLGWYQDGEYISSNFRTTAQKRKTMEADFHLVPYGEVTLDIQNINCESVEDTMWFRRKWEFDDDYGNWSPPRVGCFSQSAGSTGSKVPIGNRTYQIRVKRSGVETVTEETFFIEENELTVIQLHY